MKLTQIAVDRPITTSMFFLIIIVISVVCLMRLPIDLMPDVTYPSLSVVVEYPGAAPEEIETLVVRPIEEAMGGVDGVERLDASAQEERGVVRLRFTWGSDLDVVANDVRTRIDRIRGSLPEDVQPPVLYKYDFNMSPIIEFGLTGNLSAVELRHLADNTLKPRFERLSGVASVEVAGGLRREIQVNLIKEKLDALKISPLTVVQRIREENLDLPAGEVGEGNVELLVRTYGQFRNVDDLNAIVVATRDGVPIYLRNIAEVVDGFEELRDVRRINTEAGIELEVVKESDANTVQVAERVRAEVAKVQQEMPYLSLSILDDDSVFVRDAIDGVSSAAIFGSILAVLILLFFLRNLVSTLIIASAIPVAVMASFALIYFGGFTLNIVSFGGLALGIGLLVDNSIVVLENIFRHRDNGDSPRDAAINGTGEVWLAILASTLTTVVVFIPLLFLTGPAKVMFGQMSYIVTFSLACSLFVSLTLVPMLCRLLLKPHSFEATANESLAHKFFRLSESMFNAMDEGYRRLLHLALAHRVLVIFASVSVFLMALPFFRLVPFEYMPETDEGAVRVYAEAAPGTNLETMDEAFVEIEDIVYAVIPQYIDNTETRFGVSAWYRGGGGNSGSMNINLTEGEGRDMSSQEIADLLREELSGIPGFRVYTRASGGLFIFRILQGQGENVSVDIRGHDQHQAYEIAEQVKHLLEEIPGISDARIGSDEGRPDVGLIVDRAKAAEYGLSVSQIARAIRVNFGGEVATRFREGGDEYDIRVRLRDADRTSVASLETLWLVTPNGERVPASNFVKQRRGEGPTEIERVDQERSLSVYANLTPEATLGNVMQVVTERLGQLRLPENFALVYGGEYEDQQESYQQLALGLLLALLLVYMVMASQFESLLQPLIIMFAIPFALIGVIGALLVTGTTLNVQSILGITMLSGIVVNNAIVLVDYTNILRRDHGVALHQAVEDAGRRRLRPILMTTLTTMLALVPMAIGLGSGSELQSPMARVVIGGLLTSTLITLVFIPTLYSLVEEFLEKRRAGKAEATGPETAGEQSLAPGK